MIRKPLFLILLLFTVTRLINLTLLPIYADEANYLDWGWRSLHSPGYLYYSLYDAKQPLLIWLFGFSQIIFSDPLFAGRLVSIICGLTCLLGIFFTTRRLFDLKSAYLASIFYILIPIFLFFDRQALMETSIAAVGIWSFYFLDRFLQNPCFKNSLFLGLILAAGIWIKNSALLFIVSFFVILTLYIIKNPKKTFSLLNYVLISLTTLFIVLFPLFFQPDFWKTFELNSRYALGIFELLKFPLRLWLKNFTGVTDISFFFVTPFVFLGALWGFFKFKSSHFYLLLWTLIPLLQVILTTKTLNLRYPASFLVPLVIFSAAVLPKRIPVYILTLILPLAISLVQIFNPPKYFTLMSVFSSYSYINDYVTGNLTGYLVNDILTYIKNSDTSTPVTITFALNSGNFEAALIDYLHKNPRINTAYLDSGLFSDRLHNYDCLYIPDTRLYFIAREQQQGGLNRFFIPKDVITPSHGSDYATVYILRSDCPPEKTISISLAKSY